MIRNRTISVFLPAALLVWAAAFADTLTGRVVDAAANPLAGVKVSLSTNKVSDTTGADGVFTLIIPGSAIAPDPNAAGPLFAVRENLLELQLATTQNVSIDIFSLNGQKAAAIFSGLMNPGRHDFSLENWAAALAPGLYVLAIRLPEKNSILPVYADGRDILATAGAGPGYAPDALLKAAATAVDTLSMSKSGYFAKQAPLSSLATQNLGDYILDKDGILVGNTNQDQYDQFLVTSTAAYGMDSSMAMVLKAQIVIESGFNAKAISMYDTQLPCGTHSYGLLQVTPGCESGFATLPGSTPTTATISGGLNGVAATLTYANPADKTSGNTVVVESGITIDLVSDPTSSLYPTSAFNPAYNIDFGAKSLASVMSGMKSRYGGCTEADYVTMTLAGYNQGDGTVTGCTSMTTTGQSYANNVLSQYRTFCKAAGITALY